MGVLSYGEGHFPVHGRITPAVPVLGTVIVSRVGNDDVILGTLSASALDSNTRSATFYIVINLRTLTGSYNAVKIWEQCTGPTCEIFVPTEQGSLILRDCLQ